MEGAAPNLEKLYEQKIVKKLSYSVQALLGLYKMRDRQLVGLLNKAVIPPQLVLAKNWYQLRIKNAKSKRFKDVLTYIYKTMLSPLVDMFMPYPVPIDTLLKDKATSHGEIDVIGVPKKSLEEIEHELEEVEKKPVGVIDEERMQEEKAKELAKLEAKLYGETDNAFEGPDSGKPGPFISFGRIDDDES